jgi:hypothetical protein
MDTLIQLDNVRAVPFSMAGSRPAVTYRISIWPPMTAQEKDDVIAISFIA